MSDDGDVIAFDDAKRPHVFRRKEGKLKALRKAFKAVTEESMKAVKAASGKGKPKNPKKRKKKKK